MNDSKQLTNKRSTSLKDLLSGDEFRDQLAMSLPRHLTPERFVRVAQTALSRVPQLRECDQLSFFRCLLDLSAMGLEPDGRRAHLIPFRDNRAGKVICTLIIDYKGLVELCRRSGEIKDIHCDVVHENDEFEYSHGTGSKLVHRPALTERGQPVASYSYVRLTDGSESFEVLGVDEVESVRKRSRAGSSGPWVTDWAAMARKTAFRRHSKWLPISVELRDKIERDDDQFEFEGRPQAKRAKISRLSLGHEEADESTPIEGQQDKSPAEAPQTSPKASEQPEATDTPEPAERLPEAKPEPQRRAKRLKKLPADARKKLSELTTVAEVDDWEKWWGEETEDGAVEKLAAEHRELVRSQPAADASESGELFP